MRDDARISLIDSLRGISAVSVALFHFSESYAAMSDPYHRATKWGWLGVTVFFVISGFCIGAARERDDPLPFWARRLVRIFPPYWGSLLVVFGVVAFRLVVTGVNDVTVLPKSLAGWVCVVTALTAPASSVSGLNWVTWSLSYELAFYVLMGLLAFRLAPLVAGLLSVLMLVLPVYPFNLWGVFGLGLACHHFTRGRRAAAAIIGIPAVIGCLLGLGWPQSVSALVTAALILFPPRWLVSAFFSPFRWVGQFSYSLYLVHVPIGCQLLRDHLFTSGPERPFWPALGEDVVRLVGSAAFAYGFYRLIEKPSHQLARRIMRRPVTDASGPERNPVPARAGQLS